MDDTVFAFADLPDGTLAAGGTFTTPGGILANRVARWTGSGW
jgi:hypothetical protein